MDAEPDAATVAVAWVSDEILDLRRLDDLVRRLAGAFAQTGLWPLAAVGLDDDLERPWHDGELAGPDPQTFEAVDVLAEADTYEDDEIGPTVPFLGLADLVPGPDLTADALSMSARAGLLLVPVDRPANVPKAIGWQGPMNYDLGGEAVSAVLRSWEDRFGAVLTAIGFDILELQVARPPDKPRWTDSVRGRASDAGDQLDKLVGEHYAFCPDNIDQGMEAAKYRSFLSRGTHWAFWWD
ncbi:MAG: DUF4253 domain-containing protein [Micrococcales bacterium]|nr:DUF4253 domain-containing protein [Micrococcales bacterium]